MDIDKVIAYTHNDKKAVGNTIKFILLKKMFLFYLLHEQGHTLICLVNKPCLNNEGGTYNDSALINYSITDIPESRIIPLFDSEKVTSTKLSTSISFKPW